MCVCAAQVGWVYVCVCAYVYVCMCNTCVDSTMWVCVYVCMCVCATQVWVCVCMCNTRVNTYTIHTLTQTYHIFATRNFDSLSRSMWIFSTLSPVDVMLECVLGIGMVLGPLAGGSLSKIVGYSMVALIAGFGSVVVSVLSFFFMKNSKYVFFQFWIKKKMMIFMN